MLKSVELHGVGPVADLSATFGERLNIFTGDNGLGKSFLLDVCFWTLTGTWPGARTAIPAGNSKIPAIKYSTQGNGKPKTVTAKYDFKAQSWPRSWSRPKTPGLVIYAGVDGSFAVWDTARYDSGQASGLKEVDEVPRAFQFRPESFLEFRYGGPLRRDVANGLEEDGHVLCNGLIADWSDWYYQRTSNPAVNPFEYLEAVVATLSHPSEQLGCEEPAKVFLYDSRKFPTLRMPYGLVPYPHWSAGVKRVINFAYLIVWAWVEHLQAAKLRREEPTDQITLIVDEIEAHLHPKWQRTILPAILKVVEKLQSNIKVQVLAATHSPLVLASLEPNFNEESDQLFWFDLRGSEVAFQPYAWAKHGDVVGWLTSPIFGLTEARSSEAESIIGQAEEFMARERNGKSDYLMTLANIQTEMRRVLPGDDPIWSRWFLKTQGGLPQ